ncbi:hypothetical protein Tco_0091438 [Tanacetum coccineum]
MVAENTKKTPQESASVQPATKRATPKKPTTTTPVKQTKPAPPPTKKPSKRKLPQKVRKGKPTFQLVDEDDEAQQESIPQEEEKGEGEGDDADLERAIKLSLDPAFLPQGRHLLEERDQTPPDSTTGPSSQPDDDTSEKVIHESSSTSDSERTEVKTKKKKKKSRCAVVLKVNKDQDGKLTRHSNIKSNIPGYQPEQAHEACMNLDPEPMKEDQTGSDSGRLHVSLAGPNPEHMDDDFLATAYPKEKSKVREESDSTIPDSSHQTVTSTPPMIAPFTEVSSSKSSLLVTPPPINTEATTITTSLLEITPFIALQFKSVKDWSKEMSEVKKTDHSADVLASIRSQVPTAVDNYLGTKLDDALLKNQESEKSPKEIIRAKKEQDEEKQDSTYSIRSTDKVDLEEFDLKSALFNHMNKKKSWIKEVADKVKDHKRKHDSDDDEDDDDDEGPSAGSNQGRSTKKRRSDSAASGSAKPPPKDDDQSSKKPRESEASASKQHPTLTSTGWQITDTREAGVDSSMHRSDPESEHSEQSSDDISMQDEGKKTSDEGGH